MLKNIIITFFTFSIISCGSNDNGDNSQYEIKNRIRKVIDKTYSTDYTLNFMYNGDVYDCYSIKSNSEDDFINFYYENNNLISAFEYTSQHLYTQENGNIIEDKIVFLNRILNVYKYFYNSENQIIKTEIYANNNDVIELLQYSLHFYDDNENNFKTEYYLVDSGMTGYDINTFDNKNNVFKNFEPKISILQFNPYGNNIMSRTHHYLDIDSPPDQTIYSYEYNSNDYPITGSVKYHDNSTTYKYEYTYD